MYICRTPTVFTGATCISVGLQVRHVYLSDYRIDIYICRISNSIIVPSPTYIFVGLLNITWTILLRSNIYTVRLLLKIFLLQSLLMEISEDTAMAEDNFLRNIHIYLNTSSAELWRIFWEIFIYVWILRVQSFSEKYSCIFEYFECREPVTARRRASEWCMCGTKKSGLKVFPYDFFFAATSEIIV